MTDPDAPHPDAPDPDAPDPLVDERALRREAGVDRDNPLGRPGRPLSRRSPFLIGLTGAFGVATAYLLVEAVIDARQVLVLIAVSAFLALGLDPVVGWLSERGIPRRLAIGLVFVLVIAGLVGFVAAIVPPVTRQVTSLTTRLPHYLAVLQHNPTLARLDDRFGVIRRAQDYLDQRDLGTRAVGGILGVGRLVISTTFSVLTVLILTLYFLGSLPVIRETAYRLAPRSRRARVKLLGDEILGKIGGYVAGAAAIAAIAGSCAFVFLTAAGAPYPLVLAMVVAVTDVVPLVGATVGAAVVVVVCLFSSVGLGIAAAVYFVVYQQAENYLIYPRVMRRTVDVPPALTIVAVLVGGTLLGLVGALLAIPTAAAVSIIVREVLLPRQEDL